MIAPPIALVYLCFIVTQRGGDAGSGKNKRSFLVHYLPTRVPVMIVADYLLQFGRSKAGLVSVGTI